ncbi:trehalose-phosphatase [Microbacterium betulae]|uniref:Trehalose 6-phosphate phosphatase n=1 Tax=Microbacterium betulae TaxID=2981139 RepID=A0AA97FER1_9MICO|nr:trehalose-phosphatase [Microbacterium sp. AB]WOF21788.1 trehalose-phosphatase [Microbacterium sp. AB]
MTRAHDDRGADSLEPIAKADRLLVALDFDGVLAPLVDEPMSARATARGGAAVDRLAALPRTTVALVSGRSLADLRIIAEHDDASRIWLAGSHGAEHWRPEGTPAHVDPVAADTASASLAEAVTADARRLVADVPGVRIEPKAYGFALHTRLAGPDETASAQAAIESLVAQAAPGWRRRTGKDVVEFAWRHEGKDTAVAELRKATGASAVLFAGDDVTDEDALRSLCPGDLGVHVGEGETAASLLVPDPDAFAELLSALADLRAS